MSFLRSEHRRRWSECCLRSSEWWTSRILFDLAEGQGARGLVNLPGWTVAATLSAAPEMFSFATCVVDF